jgi:hypothetical protein
MRYHRRLVPPSDLGPVGRLLPPQRTESYCFPVTIINLLRKGSADLGCSKEKLYPAFRDLIIALQRE